MEIRPVDLPLVKSDALADVAQYGVRRYRLGLTAIENRYGPTDHPISHDTTARRLAAAQIEALTRAGLFYVSSDMLRLAQEAARTLNTVDVFMEDMPSHHGFIYFGHRIRTRDDSNQVGVQAASWMPIYSSEDDPYLVITWFLDGSAARDVATPYEDKHPPVTYRLVNQELFCLWGIGAEQVLWVGDEPKPMNSNPEGMALATLFSVWHIMRQPLATVTDARYDRAAQRRLKRAKLEPQPVRIIALRRRVSAQGDDSTGDREYHHQWLVKGHWRQQWYPSLNRHRPAWIAPYVKGPDGAPFLGVEKVYSLRQ